MIGKLTFSWKKLGLKTKECAKSVGADYEILKYRDQFPFNGWISDYHGFLLTGR